MPALTRIKLLDLLCSKYACADSISWVESTSAPPGELWATCQRGDWMLWIAAKIEVDRKAIVLAACACARLALPYVRAGEPRPLAAIETAERWARGDTSVTVERLRETRRDAAYVACNAAYAAAAYAAYAAYAYAAADAAAYAADAYAAAADAYAAANAAAADDDDGVRSKILAQCADLVRAMIPWSTVEAAALTALGAGGDIKSVI